MIVKSVSLFLYTLTLGAVTILSCSSPPESDPCCSYTRLDYATDVEQDQGLLQIDGSTSAYYFVLDDAGRKVKHERLNHSVALDAGSYRVEVNGSAHKVSIASGYLARCATGTLITSGKTSDRYDVADLGGVQLASQVLGKSLSLFPGEHFVRVNNTEAPASIKPGELTEIRTGSLLVHGATGEYYYVLDKTNKQLGFTPLEKMLSFLPGTYEVKVNNTSLNAEVSSGKVTELSTGILVVKGLTEEYYYVTDTAGGALGFQVLGKAIALFPGKYNLQVNNTSITGTVAAGRATEFDTGSLTMTGTGTAYYYVFDESGKQLNYNLLNKSLSFFPSDYTVKLGPTARKTSVIAGQVTSLEAFNE